MITDNNPLIGLNQSQKKVQKRTFKEYNETLLNHFQKINTELFLLMQDISEDATSDLSSIVSSFQTSKLQDFYEQLKETYNFSNAKV